MFELFLQKNRYGNWQRVMVGSRNQIYNYLERCDNYYNSRINKIEV